MIDDDDLLITPEHLATVRGFSSRPGYCVPGAQRLCARYGIDWDEVVRNGGIPASRLLATGNALARRLVEHARQVEAQRGRR